jgi:hypothetical protein
MGGGVALHERLRGGDDGNIVPLTRPFRRGRKFGTLLVDLDLHQVIDVLAERSSQTSAAKIWPKTGGDERRMLSRS